MSRDELEQRILDRLKEAVFEKDQELKEHKDEKQVREATKEALAQMTALDNADVEKLYQLIKQEEYAREEARSAARKKRIQIVVAILGLVGMVGAYFAYQHFKPKPVYFTFSQTFDNPDSTAFLDVAEVKFDRRIEGGSYVYQVYMDDWCYWNGGPKLSLPESYTITANSRWRKGANGSYGIALIRKSEDHMSFLLSKPDKAGVSVYEDDEYSVSDWDSKIFDPEVDNHQQRIVVNQGRYQYFVNEKLIREGEMPDMEFTYVGFRSCDIQTVAFDDITIKNNRTGEILLEEDFENPSEELESAWRAYRNFKYDFRREETGYVMEIDNDGYCNRADAFLPEVRRDKFWELSADATWLTGDGNTDFGILVLNTKGEALQLLLRNDGNAIFKYVGDDFDIKEESGRIKTPAVSTGEETHHLVMRNRGGRLEFWIDGRKIHAQDIPVGYASNVEKIGMIVCSEQKSVFDNITYRELPE